MNKKNSKSQFKQNQSKNQQQREWSQQVLQKIINLKAYKKQSYLQKNSMFQIVSKINKSQIQIIDKFSSYKVNGFNLLEFVRFFLNIIEHNPIQNLYLTIGLVDLFKEISTYARQQRLSFSHITNFICLKILEKKQSKNQIQAKNILDIKTLKPNYSLKDYIRNPPLIYGSSDQTLYKLSPNTITIDKIKHVRAVCQSYFSHALKTVFTLDTLSEHISVYDINSSQLSIIYPSFNKIKKDVVIMGFCFSQRQFRLGAILKNYSIIFWDHQNKFQYQKSWSTTSFCQHLQTFINFLQYFNAWITCDKTGTISIWDLLNQKPQRKLKLKYYCSITSVCQIPSLNIIAVSQQSKQTSQEPMHSYAYQDKKNNLFQSNIVLYNFFSGQIITQIVSEDRVAHTIKYSEEYQVLLTAGLQKRIKIYQINPLYMDANLKGQLIGHQNLITCFTLIKKTSLLVSSDDKGKIKLWDFKNSACIQTLDFSDKAMISNLLDMIQVGKIGIFGSRINYIDFQDKQEVIKQIKKKEKLTIEAADYDQNKLEVYVFTLKDLRVLDMQTGAIKHIFKNFNFSDGDFTCFKYFSCIGKFALGNDKGEIMIYSISTGELSYQLKAQHEGSVLFIQYDQLNKIFISVGLQSSILLHKQCSKELVREMKSNYNGKQISCFQLSVYHNLIAIGTHQKQESVYLWNYQYAKIVGQIKLNNQCPTNLKFINNFNILVISCQSGNILFVQIIPSANYQIQLRQIQCVKTGNPIVFMNLDINICGGNKSKLEKCILYTSHENGQINIYDLSNFLQKFSNYCHSKQKTNYNPFRQIKQNFSFQVIKNKHCKLSCFKLAKKRFSGRNSNNLSKSFQISQKQAEQIVTTANQNQNNISQILHIKCMETGFNPLNIVKLINFECNYVMSVGSNRRIKIFDQNYNLVCDMNVNYPLPYVWTIKPKKKKKLQDKIYFCIKIINTILSKYQNDISIGQSKNLKLKPLFDSIRNSKQKSIEDQEENYQADQFLTQPKEQTFKSTKIPKVPLLQQQYTKNDLNYQLVKQFNFYEIAGPTLKQLDHIKKIQILQKQWKQKQKIEQADRQKLLKVIQTKVRKNQQKQQLGVFLSSNSHSKTYQTKQTPFIQSLMKKIQTVKQQQQPKQRNNTLFKFFKGASSSKDKQITLNTEQNFFRRHKSNKMINKRMQTTFENYYQQKLQKSEKQNTRKDSQLQIFKTMPLKNNKIIDKAQILQRNVFTAQKGNTKKLFMQKGNEITISNSKLNRKLVSHEHYRFRTILTEMDSKIRNKKIKNIQ